MNYTELISRYKLNYEIVKLKHHGKTFREIGNQYNLCGAEIAYKYRNFLFKLFRCYREFLSSRGIENIDGMFDFYENIAITIASMEQIYDESLCTFRHGEPPLLLGFYKYIPSFRSLTARQTKILEKEIVAAKEQRNETYAEIGDTLDLTANKVKALYQSYYHRYCLKAIEIIEPTVDFSFTSYIFSYSHYPQVRWRLITEEYANLIQDLIE